MGSSPREDAASAQLKYLKDLVPDISQPTFNFEDILKKVLGQIDTSGSMMTSSLGQATGEQLSAAGVAGGQPRAEAYITQLAPAFADIAKTKGLITSDLAKFDAGNQLDVRKLLLALTGQQGDVMQLLKGSTGFGDILGVLQTLGNVFSSGYGALKGVPKSKEQKE